MTAKGDMKNLHGFSRADYLAATPELHTGESEGCCRGCGEALNESGYCEAEDCQDDTADGLRRATSQRAGKAV